MPHSDQWSTLEQRINSLLAKYDMLLAENEHLKKQIKELNQNKPINQLPTIPFMMEEIDNKNSSVRNTNNLDIDRIQKEIKQSVTQIDNCIAMLHKTA